MLFFSQPSQVVPLFVTSQIVLSSCCLRGEIGLLYTAVDSFVFFPSKKQKREK